LLPAFLVVLTRNMRKRAWTPRVAAIFAVTAALTTAPWLYRNYRQGLGLMLSSVGGYNLHMGNNAEVLSDGSRVTQPPLTDLNDTHGEAGADHWSRNHALQWIADHPGRYLQLCGVRALGLLATKPSPYTVSALTHWKLSPEEFHAYKHRKTEPAEFRKHRSRHARATRWAHDLVRWWYALVSPLMLVGAAFAVPHFRRYALLSLPLGAYLAGLALTFSQPRFRELSDPIFYVFIALLASDLLWGTRRLGKRPSRRLKLVVTAAALVIFVSLEASDTFTSWYTLAPLEARASSLEPRLDRFDGLYPTEPVIPASEGCRRPRCPRGP
ncbi:MAG TPA: hypothetical protein VFU02_11615, partial [Polyangiaceae bacterium]|nr:hypothetical protein [Polyangiaceae bacterium]